MPTEPLMDPDTELKFKQWFFWLSGWLHVKSGEAGEEVIQGSVEL